MNQISEYNCIFVHNHILVNTFEMYMKEDNSIPFQEILTTCLRYTLQYRDFIKTKHCQSIKNELTIMHVYL